MWFKLTVEWHQHAGRAPSHVKSFAYPPGKGTKTYEDHFFWKAIQRMWLDHHVVEVIHQQGEDTDENQWPISEEREMIRTWIASCVSGIHDERNISNRCGMTSNILLSDKKKKSKVQTNV